MPTYDQGGNVAPDFSGQRWAFRTADGHDVYYTSDSGTYKMPLAAGDNGPAYIQSSYTDGNGQRWGLFATQSAFQIASDVAQSVAQGVQQVADTAGNVVDTVQSGFEQVGTAGKWLIVGLVALVALEAFHKVKR